MAMPANESLIAVPIDLKSPDQTRQFLVRLVEALDIVLGLRGGDPYVALSQIQALVGGAQTDLANILALLQQHTSNVNNPHNVTHSQLPDVSETDNNPHGNMRWRRAWESIQYYKNDVVRQDLWTMVANKDTLDYAAPQPTGAPLYIYDGTLTPAPLSAKQIIFGNRYTFAQGGYIVGYRIDVVSGNHYRVDAIIDSLGDAILTPLFDFDAAVTGWVEFNINPVLTLPGQTIDLIAVVNEPDPTPITFNGNWNYTTPQNAGIPGSGVAEQANSSTDLLRINYIDDDLGDRTAELQALTNGDKIVVGGVEWSIQNNTDVGPNNYAALSIAPAVQLGADILYDFVFETVVATPITTGSELDYWLTSSANAQGLFGVDIDYTAIVPDDTARGTDLKIQAALISDDWDVVAAPAN